MSATPDLDRILDFISTIDRGAPSTSPDELLEQALPVIAAGAPGIQFARVYRLSDPLALSIAATDEAIPPKTILELSDEQRKVVQAQTPMLVDAVWITPLVVRDQVFGLLEIGLEADPSAQVTNWLKVVVHHLSLALESVFLRDLMNRQTAAVTKLVRCTHFQEMAEAIAETMLTDSSQFIMINLAEYDERDNLLRLRPVAVAPHEQTGQSNDLIELNAQALGFPLNEVLTQGEPILVNDILSNQTLPPALRDWLARYDLQALYSLPLRQTGRPFGIIGIASTAGPLFLNLYEQQIYQNLTDQVAALVQIHHLSEESAYSGSIQEPQTRAFAELTSSQDFQQMAATIAKHMLPTSGCFLTLSKFMRDAQGNIADWRILATANHERSYDWQQAVTLEWQQVLPTVRKQIAAEPVLVFDDLRLLSPDTFGPTLYKWFDKNSIQSFLNIPMMVGGEPISTLSVMGTLPTPFTPTEIRAFQTLADQISALIYTRILLEEAQAIRDIGDNLVLASRLITTAENYQDMAQAAIYTIAQGMSAVVLSLFDRILTPNDVPQYGTLVAIGAVDGSLPIDPSPTMEWLPTTNQLDNLRKGMPLYNLAHRQSPLAKLKLVWSASFGLRAGDQLLGTLDIVNDQPRALAQSEIDALVTLADQIGVMVRSRDLLRQTTESLNETRLLYEINRSILSAQDTLDILRALRTHIASDAASITHTSITYDENDRFQKATVDYVNTPDSEQVIEVSLNETVGPEGIKALDDYWSQQPEPVIFVEDADTQKDYPMSGFLQTLGTRSYAALAIRERGRISEAIAITFATPRSFDPQQRRLYLALAEQISIILQNHRLLRDAQINAVQLSKQVNILQTLNQISSIVSATQDEKTLLETGTQGVMRAVGADHCSILLLNPPGTVGTVVSEYPAYGMLGLQFTMADNPLYERISRSENQPIVIQATESDPLLKQSTREVLQGLNIQAMIILPLFVHGKFTGSLGLDWYTPDRPLTAEMAEVAQTITNQIAIGLQNIRLLNDARRRAEQLQRITAFGQSVEATLDLATIFNIMLTESAQMVMQDQMSISLYEVISGRLRVVATRVDDVTTIDLVNGDTLPITGHIARVWNNWELLHIPDAPAETNTPGESSIRSWILAPILSRGRLLGMVSVGCVRPYAYSDTDVTLFQQMVNQLAITLENAQAFAQSQRLARNESLINEISSNMQQELDLQHMMNVTVNQLGKALGARRGRIRLGVIPPEDENEEQD